MNASVTQALSLGVWQIEGVRKREGEDTLHNFKGNEVVLCITLCIDIKSICFKLIHELVNLKYQFSISLHVNITLRL